MTNPSLPRAGSTTTTTTVVVLFLRVNAATAWRCITEISSLVLVSFNAHFNFLFKPKQCRPLTVPTPPTNMPGLSHRLLPDH
jgi:hypothetical protein